MTMTEIDLRGQPGILQQKMMYAEYLAKGDLLPRAYQGKPWNVLLVAELGESLGLTFAQSLELIHVIDGKPSASVRLLAARVREAGHTLRVSYDPETRTARAEGWRRDDPEHVHAVEWSWDRANAIIDPKTEKKLTDKANWRNYYPAMLKWRAQDEWIGDMCPEVALGVSYSPDELGASELTDDEADDLGVMTRRQRVEHAELRRMGEPAAGAVEKLDATPADDPFYTEAADVQA